MTDPALFTTDESAAAEAQRSLADRDRDAFRKTLQHAFGRQALRAILRRCNLNDESFATNSSLNAFRQGQQSVGYGLLRDLRAISLEHVHAMEREEAEDSEAP